MSDDVIETLEEVGRWHARDVVYYAGRWEQVRRHIPQFQAVDFKVTPDLPPNPYMKAVIRVPQTKFEQAVPVGTVSNTYTLAQHDQVADLCFEGIQRAGIKTDGLKCELGLTELGEWMNLRIYFPREYDHSPQDGKKLTLRLECFNSVDGSSRLIILLGWLRFVCSNGLVIGEVKTELRDIHNKNLNLGRIAETIYESLALVPDEHKRIAEWEQAAVKGDSLKSWANNALCQKWNKKSACRVYHICTSGYDVELTHPAAPGDATEKPIQKLQLVPGAAIPARNLYDVSQALSWIATRRNSAEEKVEWQAAIPGLIQSLRVTA